MAVVQQWAHLLRAASVVLRVLRITLNFGVCLAGNAHRLQRASFRLVLLVTAAAQSAISAQRLFEPASSTAAADENLASSLAAQSDFSWLVVLTVGVMVHPPLVERCVPPHRIGS